MHGTGFSTQASTRLYKTFVRPTLEYGLQLQALDSENSNRLERIQRAALLTIFSAPMKTSVDAMHKLTLLESMAMRSHILNFNFFSHLESANENIPAAKMVQVAAMRIEQLPPQSLIKQSSQNPIKVAKIMENGPTGTTKNHIIVAELKARSANLENVAAPIHIDERRKIRTCFQASIGIDRQTRILLNQWLLGNVANHQPCRNCLSTEVTELSRAHAVECSGIVNDLQLIDGFSINSNDPQTPLDQAFTFAYHNEEEFVHATIGKCVGKILSKCLHFTQQENGYWIAQERTDCQNNTRSTHASTRPNPQPRKRKTITKNFSKACVPPDLGEILTGINTTERSATPYQVMEPQTQAELEAPDPEEVPAHTYTRSRRPADEASDPILDRPTLPPFRTLWPWSPPNRRRRRNRLQSPAEIMNQAEWHNRHRQQRRAPERSAIQPLNYTWNINDANVHRWFYYPP
jgi:hypothetical protein